MSDAEIETNHPNRWRPDQMGGPVKFRWNALIGSDRRSASWDVFTKRHEDGIDFVISESSTRLAIGTVSLDGDSCYCISPDDNGELVFGQSSDIQLFAAMLHSVLYLASISMPGWGHPEAVRLPNGTEIIRIPLS